MSSPMYDFQLLLEKSDAKKVDLGIVITKPATRPFVDVKSVKDDGLVSDWNKANPDHHKVDVGDSIVDVNGVNGDTAKMMKEFEKDRILISIKKGTTCDVVVDVSHGRETDVGFEWVTPCLLPIVLIVSKIKDQGVLSEYNRKNPTLAVQPGDTIVAVNSIRNDPAAMSKELLEQTVSISVRHAPYHDYVARIDRTSNEKIGMGISVTNHKTLSLQDIKMSGAAANWNKANPDSKLAVLDEVLAVNGVTCSTDAMVMELRGTSIVLLMSRGSAGKEPLHRSGSSLNPNFPEVVTDDGEMEQKVDVIDELEGNESHCVACAFCK